MQPKDEDLALIRKSRGKTQSQSQLHITQSELNEGEKWNKYFEDLKSKVKTQREQMKH